MVSGGLMSPASFSIRYTVDSETYMTCSSTRVVATSLGLNDGCSNAYLTTYRLCFVANRFHTRLGSGGRSTRPLNPLSRYLLFQR